jgi:hypothetical protein
MAVIDVSYDEGKKRSYKAMNYRGVNLMYTSKGNRRTKKKFFTGNFVKDWYNMWKFILTNDISSRELISGSSSCDHFIFDGAPFKSAYLHFVKKKPVLKYLTYQDIKDKEKRIQKMHQEMYICEDGIEQFVPKGTRPTWEELKAFVNGETQRLKKYVPKPKRVAA